MRINFKEHTKIHKRTGGFLFIIFLLLSSFQQSFSQDNEYARELIKQLCSEEYHGRGYDFGSDNQVADLIIKELKKNKVKSFGKEYKQSFNINVNTLPGNNFVSIDGNNLEPGEDFLTAAFSQSISGTYNIVKLDASIIDDSIRFRKFIGVNYSDKALLIDTAGLKRKDFSEGYNLITQRNVLKAKIVIRIEDQNLIYVPSQIYKDFSLISVKRGIISSVPKSITVDIASHFLKDYETHNIIGYLPGKTDTAVVFSAHYDHIGHNGLKTYFPGANDNASGVAMLLNLAKILSKEKKLKYTVVFMFFSAEELGLLGSKYYTEHPVFPMSKIKFLVNLDMVGSGDEGIQVVNGSVFKKEFNLLSDLNKHSAYLPEIKTRGEAANSDHYFFYKNGVKSFFIYTLGTYKEYHTIHDKPENLPLSKFTELTSLLIDFYNNL